MVGICYIRLCSHGIVYDTLVPVHTINSVEAIGNFVAFDLSKHYQVSYCFDIVAVADGCACCAFAVRTKLSIASDVPVKYVLNGDGCEVDKEDIIDMLPLTEPLMILKGTEIWTKVYGYS